MPFLLSIKKEFYDCLLRRKIRPLFSSPFYHFIPLQFFHHNCAVFFIINICLSFFSSNRVFFHLNLWLPHFHVSSQALEFACFFISKIYDSLLFFLRVCLKLSFHLFRLIFPNCLINRPLPVRACVNNNCPSLGCVCSKLYCPFYLIKCSGPLLIAEPLLA